MITREQVADLREGDVVELQVGAYAIRGPLDSVSGELRVHIWVVQDRDGRPYLGETDRTLTVISRAKPPLYVNSDKTEPDPGDVVRDADNDDDAETWTFGRDSVGVSAWRSNVSQAWRLRQQVHARLRLLVDGTTGQVVR